MRVIHQNLHRSQVPVAEVQAVAGRQQVAVFLLQEPPLREGKVLFPGYDVHATTDARAAVAAERALSLAPCPELSSRDQAAAVWQTQGGRRRFWCHITWMELKR